MRIGLWNIDHPEVVQERGTAAHKRYRSMLAFLNQQGCDVFILTEANAAMQLPGYQAAFSAESPFIKRSRNYEPPNRYHQVGIYSRYHLKPLEIAEPTNGLLCRTIWQDQPLLLYGNVITIKDQFTDRSDKKYSDRLGEQLAQFAQLASKRVVIAGDFNLRLGWPQKKGAHQKVKEIVEDHGLVWPTQERTDTVQHVIHSSDICGKVSVDASVQHNSRKKDGLSDHPFLLIDFIGRPFLTLSSCCATC